jgi:hypothetical protein
MKNSYVERWWNWLLESILQNFFLLTQESDNAYFFSFLRYCSFDSRYSWFLKIQNMEAWFCSIKFSKDWNYHFFKSWKCIFLINFEDILQNMFVLAVKLGKVVCYIHEIYLGKHAEANKGFYFVSYNRDRYNRIRLYIKSLKFKFLSHDWLLL